MSSRNYLTSNLFTATVASDYELSGYISRGNDHLECVAYSLGVSPTGIADPITFMLKEYGMAWVYAELYTDKIGAQNLDTPEADKYLVLAKLHNERKDQLRATLTPEIIAGTADSPIEYAAASTLIYRN